MVVFTSFAAAATALIAATFVAGQNPNYTAPVADGKGDWAKAYNKAKAMV